MKRYELLDISGDAGIRVFGSSLQDLFRNAAAGMYELITDTSSLKADDVVEVALLADTIENALVVFLNELVFRFDTYSFIGSEIRFDAFDVPEGLVRAENGYRIRALPAALSSTPDSMNSGC